MAVTNLHDRVHPGKVVLSRDLAGVGDPSTDSRLADNTLYPVGSSFLDEATGEQYVKLSTGWTAQIQSPLP